MAPQETNTLTKARLLCQAPNRPQDSGHVRSNLLLFIELHQTEGNCRFSSPEVFLEYQVYSKKKKNNKKLLRSALKPD